MKVNDENSRIRIGSESISQRHGSADPDPDPHQNVIDPEHSGVVWGVDLPPKESVGAPDQMTVSPHSNVWYGTYKAEYRSGSRVFDDQNYNLPIPRPPERTSKL